MTNPKKPSNIPSFATDEDLCKAFKCCRAWHTMKGEEQAKIQKLIDKGDFDAYCKAVKCPLAHNSNNCDVELAIYRRLKNKVKKINSAACNENALEPVKKHNLMLKLNREFCNRLVMVLLILGSDAKGLQGISADIMTQSNLHAPNKKHLTIMIHQDDIDRVLWETHKLELNLLASQQPACAQTINELRSQIGKAIADQFPYKEVEEYVD